LQVPLPPRSPRTYRTGRRDRGADAHERLRSRCHDESAHTRDRHPGHGAMDPVPADHGSSICGRGHQGV